jgi:hypothetical protein
MYVNRAGLEYLSVLAGEPASVLQRVLPGLAERLLLPDGDEAVEVAVAAVRGASGALLPRVCASPRGRRAGLVDDTGQLEHLRAASAVE